jgi:hypothetical protein
MLRVYRLTRYASYSPSKSGKTPSDAKKRAEGGSTRKVIAAVRPKSGVMRFSFALSEKEKAKITPVGPHTISVAKEQLDELVESVVQMLNNACIAAAGNRRPLTDADLCDEEDAALFNVVGKGKATPVNPFDAHSSAPSDCSWPERYLVYPTTRAWLAGVVADNALCGSHRCRSLACLRSGR